MGAAGKASEQYQVYYNYDIEACSGPNSLNIRIYTPTHARSPTHFLSLSALHA